MESIKIGGAVGFADIAFVYPLSVLAVRRECGLSFRDALKRKNFWSGGSTAATLLVPYSIAVDLLSKSVESTSLYSSFATSVLVGGTLQPIEKKMTMDQLLNNPCKSSNPLQSITGYLREFGVQKLYKGVSPLIGREFVYITSITVLTPYVAARTDVPLVAAFSIGVCAGIASAPFQTLSAMAKDEKRVNQSLRSIFSEVLESPNAVHRLFYGAGTRSLRTGLAGCLWHLSRTHFAPDEGV